MEPNNPNTNNTPLIYRICDAAGVFHLVAPVNHTHTYQDVPGLAGELNELWSGLNEKANQEDMTEALAAKQDALTFDTTPTANSTNPVTSGGVKAALDGKQDNLTFDTTPTANSTNPVTSGGVKVALDKKDSINQVDEDDEQEAHLNAVAEDDDIYFKFRLKNGSAEKQVLLTMPKMDNLERALHTPDSTPIANSDNLVTSGGVKDAIDNAIAIRYFSAQSTSKPLIEDIFGDANLQKVDCGILNSTGSEASITDLFSISVGQTLLLPDNAHTIPNGNMVLLHLYRTITQGQFMVSIGGIYTVE